MQTVTDPVIFSQFGNTTQCVKGGAEAELDAFTVNYKPPTLSKISLEVNGGTNQVLATLSGNFNRYMEQPGIPTLGNMIILDGSNFGQQGYVKWCLEPSATIDGCDENLKYTKDCCKTWDENTNATGSTYGHDQIKFNVPAGVGVGRAIYVVQHRTPGTTKIFNQNSQVFTLRYKAPRVTSVAYEGGSSGHQYANTRGGIRITLSGNYFGSASAIGEVVPSKPTIRLYRQSDIDNGNAVLQKEEAEADPLSNANDRTSSLTNEKYPSWGPAITIESTGWTDSSATFVVPKGIGYNISIALTVGGGGGGGGGYLTSSDSIVIFFIVVVVSFRLANKAASTTTSVYCILMHRCFNTMHQSLLASHQPRYPVLD